MIGPERLTVRVALNLARDYDAVGRHRDAAMIRLLAAIVENCPNAANLEHAGRMIRAGRARLPSLPVSRRPPRTQGRGAGR